MAEDYVAEIDFGTDLELVRARARRIQASVGYRRWEPNRPFERALSELQNSLTLLQEAQRELRARNRALGLAHAHEQCAHRAYRELLDFAPDGYLVTSLDGTIRDANRAAVTLLRGGGGELVGSNLADFVDEALRPAFRERVRALSAEGSIRTSWEHPMRGGDAPLTVSITTEAIRDQVGRSTGLRWMIRDISAERRAEQALRASEAESRAIVDAAVDGILTVDASGRIQRCNPAAERIFGYQRARLVGQNLAALMSSPGALVPAGQPELAQGDSVDDVLADLERAAAGAGAVEREVCGLHVDGRVFPLRLSIGAAPSSGVRFFTVVARDLSGERQMEEQLLHAQKMEAIGRLAGGVAHDFNNLLLIILGRSEVLLDRLSLDRDRRHIENIRKCALRAASLTRKLLAFSRRQASSPRIVQINDVIRDLEEILHLTVGEDVDLTLQLADDLAFVAADPGHLEQVIMNLVVNARDAVCKGGNVVVETANTTTTGLSDAGGGEVRELMRLTVRDDGVGMDEDTRARIFDPYFTTKREDKGTGLGLSTVYGIVEQNRGYITVDSAPGRGAAFHVYLPRVRTPAGEPCPAAEPRSRGRRAHVVLLVEDGADARAAMIEVLREDGFLVAGAANAHEALALVADGDAAIDLVVTDLAMPGMNGRELVDRLRHDRPELKAILMSGYGELEPLCGGGTGYLQKPFSAAELCRQARRLFE